MICKIIKILNLFLYRHSVNAILRWPVFSLTSFIMISNLTKQQLQPKTIIDVGANVGQFSVASVNLFEDVQVYAFEPVPESFEKLHKHVSKLNNVRAYALALGEDEGNIGFHVNTHSHSSSILALSTHHLTAFPGAKEDKVISVPITTLDSISNDFKLVSPVLLKLDVQGYEANVLKGAVEILKKVDYVLLETSFKPMYEGELLFTEILQFMGNCGFKFLRPMDFLRNDKTGEILQVDALFERVI